MDKDIPGIFYINDWTSFFTKVKNQW